MEGIMRTAISARLAVPLCLFLNASAASAQALRLDEAVQRAVESNPDLAAARQQIVPLRERPAQRRSFAPPILEAQAWQWPINTLNPANTNMFMLTASQDLSGRGKRQALTTLAERDVTVAEAAVKVQERDVVAAVTEHYWNLSIVRRQVALRRAGLSLIRELTDVAQARYASGRTSQQDVLRGIVEATTIEADLLDLEQQAAQATLRLNQLMNRALDAPVGALDIPVESSLKASASDIEMLGNQFQPDVAVARATEARAEAQQFVARTAATPEWAVGGGYMVQPRQTDAWTATISVTWPGAPWSRRALSAQAAEATAAVSAARAGVTARQQAARAAMAEAHLRIKSAERRAALVRTALLPQSRQALAVSQVGYQADRADFAAVIDSERALLLAELQYDQALSDSRRALADLERSVGAPIPAALLVPVNSTEVPR